jgi:hypothetical protein
MSDLFKDFMGEEIDLDDLSNYPDEWKEMHIQDLFTQAWISAGKSIFYMKYMWAEDTGEQWYRVDVLCKELVGEKGRKRYEEKDRLQLMKWLYRFKDEVENQC